MLLYSTLNLPLSIKSMLSVLMNIDLNKGTVMQRDISIRDPQSTAFHTAPKYLPRADYLLHMLQTLSKLSKKHIFRYVCTFIEKGIRSIFFFVFQLTLQG